MTYRLKQSEWESFFEAILTTIDRTIKDMGRSKFQDVINERFYHHQFSNYTFQYFREKQIDIWTQQVLFPEAKTPQIFTWEGVDLNNTLKTRQHAVGKGTKGNYDFLISTNPAICLEWKGPNVYSVEDVAQVMLKLFSQQLDETIKIFSAIITSSQTGRTSHLEAIETYFRQGLKFALEVLEIPPERLSAKNLYVYIATTPDDGIIKCHWGRFCDLHTPFSEIARNPKKNNSAKPKPGGKLTFEQMLKSSTPLQAEYINQFKKSWEESSEFTIVLGTQGFSAKVDNKHVVWVFPDRIQIRPHEDFTYIHDKLVKSLKGHFPETIAKTAKLRDDKLKNLDNLTSFIKDIKSIINEAKKVNVKDHQN